jgi:hypothetical protein
MQVRHFPGSARFGNHDPILQPNIYQTHNNGGRKYRIQVQGNKVQVDDMRGIFLQKYSVISVFIGKSPLNKMTEFSGGHGPDFDGNSIILNMGDNEYIYFGSTYFIFKTKAPIVEFISPVGNNDVPYPYAIDEDDNFYLMTENVVVSGVPQDQRDDVYHYYYDKGYMVVEDKYKNNFGGKVLEYQGITRWMDGDEIYVLRYIPDAADDYDHREGYMYVIRDGVKEPMMRDVYIQMMKEFGDANGFQKMTRSIT